MTISPADIASIHRASGGFSVFSIDGCHMAGHTINDIRTAMELTDPRGIILVDDYHNADWPGVQEGVTKLYLYDNPRFVPLLYTCKKLFLCHVSHHERYLASVRGTLEKHYPETRLKAVRRFGYDGLTATPDLSKRARLVRS